MNRSALISLFFIFFCQSICFAQNPEFCGGAFDDGNNDGKERELWVPGSSRWEEAFDVFLPHFFDQLGQAAEGLGLDINETEPLAFAQTVSRDPQIASQFEILQSLHAQSAGGSLEFYIVDNLLHAEPRQEDFEYSRWLLGYLSHSQATSSSVPSQETKDLIVDRMIEFLGNATSGFVDATFAEEPDLAFEKLPQIESVILSLPLIDSESKEAVLFLQQTFEEIFARSNHLFSLKNSEINRSRNDRRKYILYSFFRRIVQTILFFDVVDREEWISDLFEQHNNSERESELNFRGSALDNVDVLSLPITFFAGMFGELPHFQFWRLGFVERHFVDLDSLFLELMMQRDLIYDSYENDSGLLLDDDEKDFYSLIVRIQNSIAIALTAKGNQRLPRSLEILEETVNPILYGEPLTYLACEKLTVAILGLHNAWPENIDQIRFAHDQFRKLFQILRDHLETSGNSENKNVYRERFIMFFDLMLHVEENWFRSNDTATSLELFDLRRKLKETLTILKSHGIPQDFVEGEKLRYVYKKLTQILSDP